MTSHEQKIDVFVFTINSVSIGIDTEQILDLTGAKNETLEPDLILKLSDILAGLEGDASSGNEMLLTVRHPLMDVVLLTGMPETMLSVFYEEVKPLPDIYNNYSVDNPVWGVVARENNIMLLVDIIKFVNLHANMRRADGVLA